MYCSTTYQSPLGVITLACDNNTNHLIGLWMEGQKYHGATIQETMTEQRDMPIFYKTKKWLDRYFTGEKPNIAELQLAPIGGDFRQGIWNILREIPYGEVLTYRDIAKKIAEKLGRASMSCHAVGGAVGHNPISIIIPCHRVVGANGNLTGFSAGIQTKIKLLKLEGIDTSQMFAPKKGTAL